MTDLQDVCVRSRELAKAKEIIAAGLAADRGAIVFIEGPPASGRTSLLRAIAEEACEMRPTPRVIEGSFVDERYVPRASHTRHDPEALVLAEKAVGLAGTLVPMVGLAGQVLSVARLTANRLKGFAACDVLASRELAEHPSRCGPGRATDLSH
jgi:hypothetical protein